MINIVFLPLRVTVIGLLGFPPKPRTILLTLNVQFFSVVVSCRSEQIADVSLPTRQLPQPVCEVMTYCTGAQVVASCGQLNMSFPGPMLIRSTLGCASEHASVKLMVTSTNHKIR